MYEQLVPHLEETMYWLVHDSETFSTEFGATPCFSGLASVLHSINSCVGHGCMYVGGGEIMLDVDVSEADESLTQTQGYPQQYYGGIYCR